MEVGTGKEYEKSPSEKLLDTAKFYKKSAVTKAGMALSFYGLSLTAVNISPLSDLPKNALSIYMMVDFKKSWSPAEWRFRPIEAIKPHVADWKQGDAIQKELKELSVWDRNSEVLAAKVVGSTDTEKAKSADKLLSDSIALESVIKNLYEIFDANPNGLSLEDQMRVVRFQANAKPLIAVAEKLGLINTLKTFIDMEEQTKGFEPKGPAIPQKLLGLKDTLKNVMSLGTQAAEAIKTGGYEARFLANKYNALNIFGLSKLPELVTKTK